MYIILWMYFIKFFFFKSILLFFSRLLSMENSTGKKFVPTRDKFRRGIEEGGGSLFRTEDRRNEKVKVFRVSRSSLIHTTRPRPTASHLPCPRIARVPVSRFSGVSRRKKKKKKKNVRSPLASTSSLFTDFETKNRSSFCSWKKLLDSSFGGPEVREVARGVPKADD